MYSKRREKKPRLMGHALWEGRKPWTSLAQLPDNAASAELVVHVHGSQLQRSSSEWAQTKVKLVNLLSKNFSYLFLKRFNGKSHWSELSVGSPRALQTYSWAKGVRCLKTGKINSVQNMEIPTLFVQILTCSLGWVRFPLMKKLSQPFLSFLLHHHTWNCFLSIVVACHYQSSLLIYD